MVQSPASAIILVIAAIGVASSMALPFEYAYFYHIFLFQNAHGRLFLLGREPMIWV
jgi:hypothetical protein